MMSRQEIQEQHDKLNSMAEELVAIKKMFSLWPYAVAIASFISAVVGLTISAVNYDGNLVKRPEFENHLKVENNNTALVLRYHIIDSTRLNEKEIKDREQDQRLVELESAPKYRSTRVTAIRDKTGVHFKPVN